MRKVNVRMPGVQISQINIEAKMEKRDFSFMLRMLVGEAITARHNKRVRARRRRQLERERNQ